MSDDIATPEELIKSLNSALSKIKYENLEDERASIEKEIQSPDFWNNNSNAKDISKKLTSLTRRLEPWTKLKSEVEDLVELSNLRDEKLQNEVDEHFNLLKTKYLSLTEDLKYDGPYDSHNAIISIFAGAGGTDAQDWAQMLLRMYIRWAEKKNFKTSIVDESTGEEAGVKSVTIEIEGDYVYGRLKGEQGVHRLVRLSPFNADNLRQTSFAKVEVIPMIENSDEISIDEKDLRVDVYRSSGHGGQSVNTTDSAVRITHNPTGIVVAIQNERSQLQNKETALMILRSKLAQLQIDKRNEEMDKLRGPKQSAEWGNQIRNYVLHPYKQVKDLRSKYETSDVDSVLNGEIDQFIDAYLRHTLSLNQ